MNSFISIQDGIFEYEISKSLFIGICRRVRTVSEAAENLDEIRRKYRDSTHVCYAYICDDGSKSNDDGEPSGTAGVPIMECIRSAKLNQTLVAVVRYFGGIKLGTGGLLRAYSHTASSVLAAANKVEVSECDVYKVSFEYAVYKKIEKRSFQSLYKLLGLEYNRAVEMTCAVLSGEKFIDELNTLTQGKFAAENLGKRLIER